MRRLQHLMRTRAPKMSLHANRLTLMVAALTAGALLGCRNYKLTEGLSCSSDDQCVDQKCIDGVCGGPKGGSGGSSSAGDGDGDGDGIGDLGSGDGDGDGCDNPYAADEQSIFFFDPEALIGSRINANRLTQVYQGLIWLSGTAGVPDALEYYGTVVLLNPKSSLPDSVSELAAEVLAQGGRIVVVSELCESGSINLCDSDLDVLNDIITDLGVQNYEYNDALGLQGEQVARAEDGDLIPDQPLTYCVDTLRFSSPGYVDLTFDPEGGGDATVFAQLATLIFEPEQPAGQGDQPAIAVEYVGAGEVVMIADVDLFSTESLDGDNDNAQFLRNLAVVERGKP